jgi:Ca2+-binding RTX toxin-like protein
LTTLEDRVTPSTYFVIGSPGPDHIAVSGTASELTIVNHGNTPITARPILSQAQNVVSIPAGGSFTYKPGDIGRDPVSSLTIRGAAGNDILDASGVIGLGATIEGGDGDDIIIGTPSDDILRGGNGNDTIYAQPFATSANATSFIEFGI